MIENNCLKCTQWPKAEYKQTMKGSQKNNIWIKWENLEIDGNYKKKRILGLQNIRKTWIERFTRRFNSWLEQVERRVKFEGKSIEIIKSKEQKEKKN